MRAHEAGWAHAAVSVTAPAWLREPADSNALVPQLWSSTARKVGTDGDGLVLEVGGVTVTDLVAEHGSPAYVLDEADFRARARAFRDAFADYDVYYAGKAFLCTTVARWVAEEGLFLDVCTGGELAVAERAGFPPERLGFHGNNKSAAELTRAVELGVGRIIVDSFHEIQRLAQVTERLGRTARVLIRVTAGVEAHTHEYIATAHEDQKFGFSISSGDALAAAHQIHQVPGLELLGLHSHIGSQIFDSSGFEVAARRVLALHAQISDEVGVVLPELDLGGGFGIAYTTQDDPSDPAQLAIELTKIVTEECKARDLDLPRLSIEPGRAIVGPAMCTVYEVGTVKAVELDGGFGIAYTTQDDPSDPAQLAIELTKIVTEECKARDLDLPRLSIEPGRAIVGPAMCTVYEVGTVKAVELDGGAVRTYVSVDGGMSDNIRTALYDADYSCTLASRSSDAPALLTRVVGKHCEAGDIVVKDEFLPGDLVPGDLLAVPGTGAYCRSMSSNYNHALRPPVVAVLDGVSTVVLRRETEDDLLRLDTGAGARMGD